MKWIDLWDGSGRCVTAENIIAYRKNGTYEIGKLVKNKDGNPLMYVDKEGNNLALDIFHDAGESKILFVANIESPLERKPE